ncbi:hypothetical protein LWI28_022182 [Acer negundo]|uniref:Protein FAR1-RELATED SEQUENCE n=1 Tax=Acer negundo TaxID=4023 RepID=A0AAD5NVB7_ACENE|nr:hypothetical protein LWI28_022182 [Acer negundo]
MSTTQRSESMNAFFDGYVLAKTNLKEFVDQFDDQFDNALKKKIENENVVDFHSFSVTTLCTTPCIPRSPIEKRFQELYTNYKFKEVQQQVIGIIDMNPQLHKSNGVVKTYLVKDEVHLAKFTKLMITLAARSREHTQDVKSKLYGMIDLYRANQEPPSMTQTSSNVGCTRGDKTTVGGYEQVLNPNVVCGKGRPPSLRRASRIENDMRKVKAKEKKAQEKGKRKERDEGDAPILNTHRSLFGHSDMDIANARHVQLSLRKEGSSVRQGLGGTDDDGFADTTDDDDEYNEVEKKESLSRVSDFGQKSASDEEKRRRVERGFQIVQGC